MSTAIIFLAGVVIGLVISYVLADIIVERAMESKESKEDEEVMKR